MASDVGSEQNEAAGPSVSSAAGAPWWGGGMNTHGHLSSTETSGSGTVSSRTMEKSKVQEPSPEEKSLQNSQGTQKSALEPGMPGEQHQSSSVTGTPAPLGDYALPHGQAELGTAAAQPVYPYDPYFGTIMAAYGAQAMVHPYMLGVQQARMPLPSEMMEEEPVYVNAKQYHGILRRRQIRAKAESENKLVKYRKPYLHESRHQHALRRARGCGGRFLNTKKEDSKCKSEDSSSQGNHSSPRGQDSSEEVQNGGPHQEHMQGGLPRGSHSTSMSHNKNNGVFSVTSTGMSQEGKYYNDLQTHSSHSSAFHPLSGGNPSESLHSRNFVSNCSPQAGVGSK